MHYRVEVAACARHGEMGEATGLRRVPAISETNGKSELRERKL